MHIYTRKNKSYKLEDREKNSVKNTVCILAMHKSYQLEDLLIFSRLYITFGPIHNTLTLALST